MITRILLGVLNNWSHYSGFAGLSVGLFRGQVAEHMAYGLLWGYCIKVVLLDLGLVHERDGRVSVGTSN
jgi:hypothetical protein